MNENAEMSYNPKEETDESGPFQAALSDAQHQLMTRGGIEGVGQGKTADGRDAIVVYARDERALSQLPASVRGYPVLGQVTGEFKIY